MSISISEPAEIPHPNDASKLAHKPQQISSAMFQLSQIVRFHDRETLALTDDKWRELHVLYVIVSGQIQSHSMERQVTINAGSAILRRAGIHLRSEHHHGPPSPVQGYAIAFKDTVGEPPIWPFGSPFPMKHRAILETADELVYACVHADEVCAFKLHQLFYQLLGTLHDHLSRTTREHHAWLERVIHHIHEMVAHPLTREQLAKMVNISPEHFSREFKKYTGLSFIEYMTRLRVRIAQEQLLLNNSTLQELAQVTGYRDPFYLSRKFKQFTGQPPTLYRKSAKRVVSLTYNYTSSLLAIGHVPLLGALSDWTNPRIGIEIPPTLTFLTEGECIHNLEMIAAARPDVIIGYASHPRLDELRRIAPTILLPFEEMDWQEQLRLLGRIANRETEARELLNRYDRMQHAANEWLDRNLKQRGTAICMFFTNEGGAYLYGQGWGRASQILYDALGFTPPLRMLRGGQLLTGYIHVTLADIHLYAADHIFISLPDEDEAREKILMHLNRAPWRSLDAVQNGHVYEIEDGLYYGLDPLSVLGQLQDIMQNLTSQMSKSF